jgi:ribosomal protein S27AE
MATKAMTLGPETSFFVPREERHAGREEELRESLDCEMCGAPVIANHCKRICLRCGFMTGCSEGI